MKISCPACSAKYRIPDEKVRGKNRVFKIKCKKCSAEIRVRGVATEQDEGRSTLPFSLGESSQNARQWYAELDDKQEGPLTEQEVFDHLDAGRLAAGSLVWRKGFSAWTPISEVEPFAARAAAADTATSADDTGAAPRRAQTLELSAAMIELLVKLDAQQSAVPDLDVPTFPEDEPAAQDSPVDESQTDKAADDADGEVSAEAPPLPDSAEAGDAEAGADAVEEAAGDDGAPPLPDEATSESVETDATEPSDADETVDADGDGAPPPMPAESEDAAQESAEAQDQGKEAAEALGVDETKTAVLNIGKGTSRRSRRRKGRNRASSSKADSAKVGLPAQMTDEPVTQVVNLKDHEEGDAGKADEGKGSESAKNKTSQDAAKKQAPKKKTSTTGASKPTRPLTKAAKPVKQDKSSGGGGGGLIAGVAVALCLGLVGGGVWWFKGRAKKPASAAAQVAKVEAAPAPPAPPVKKEAPALKAETPPPAKQQEASAQPSAPEQKAPEAPKVPAEPAVAPPPTPSAAAQPAAVAPVAKAEQPAETASAKKPSTKRPSTASALPRPPTKPKTTAPAGQQDDIDRILQRQREAQKRKEEARAVAAAPPVAATPKPTEPKKEDSIDRILREQREKKERKAPPAGNAPTSTGGKALAQKDVNRVAKRAQGDVMRCYMMHGDPDGKAITFKVKVYIQGTGAVSSAVTIGKNGRGAIGRCIAKAMSGLRFPSFSGATKAYTVRYTVR